MKDFAAIDFETANGEQLLYLFLFTGARTLPGRYRLCSGFSEGLGADRSADRRTSTGSTQQIV